MDIYWWIFHSYSSYVAGRQNGGVGWDGKCSKLPSKSGDVHLNDSPTYIKSGDVKGDFF